MILIRFLVHIKLNNNINESKYENGISIICFKSVFLQMIIFNTFFFVLQLSNLPRFNSARLEMINLNF